jgi:D-alanine--poly(phosphoribitol) ligase subunit 2
MDQLLEILEDIKPDNDYRTEDHLIDKSLLDSLSVLELVTTIEDTFGVEITATELIPKNFNSATAMWDMIQRLQKK